MSPSPQEPSRLELRYQDDVKTPIKPPRNLFSNLRFFHEPVISDFGHLVRLKCMFCYVEFCRSFSEYKRETIIDGACVFICIISESSRRRIIAKSL